MKRTAIRLLALLAVVLAGLACIFDSEGLSPEGDETDGSPPIVVSPPTPNVGVGGAGSTAAGDGGGGGGSAADAAPGGEEVTICHKGKTTQVDKPALQAHLAHGDTQGPCPVM